MRIGLRTKLLSVTIALLAFLTAEALGTVHYYLGKQVRQQAERSLATASHVLSSIVERTQEQLLGRGRLLVELPSLHAALTTSHQDLEPLLQEVKSLRTANLLWATDARGVVLAGTDEYPPVGQSLAHHPLTAHALGGEQTLGFDVFLDEWWLLMVFPVTPEDSSERIGTVTLALLIGHAYVERLSELIDSEVGFIWEARHQWSDGWPIEVPRRIIERRPIAQAGESQETSGAGGRRYLWRAQPLTIGIHPQVTTPVAIVGVELDDTVLRQTAQTIGWTALVVILVGAACLIAAVRSITQPLKALVGDAHRVGGGELTHRASVRGRDEVAQLARAFNRMVEGLHRSREDLLEAKRYVENVVQRVTNSLVVVDADGLIRIVNPATLELLGYREEELIGRSLTTLFAEGAPSSSTACSWQISALEGTLRNVEAIYRAKDGRHIPMLFSSAAMHSDNGRIQGIVCIAQDITERKSVERLKDEFISTVTHELRTPLTTINESLALMVDGILGPVSSDQQEFLLMAQGQVRRLHRLIETVLDLSLMEQQALTLDSRPTDLPKALEQAWQSCRAIAGHRTLVRRIATMPVIRADAARIGRVLGHLLSNAVQFTKDDGIITVGMERQNGRVVVSIADNGVGISKEGIGRLFQKFVQLGRAEEERSGGTGLGLVFCKRIIELHGGTIGVNSEPGRGTTLTFTLPAKTPEA
jgi:PAS domain S-box-containing protein